MRLQIAESLNVYEMDFYNDWLNGSLYAYLLKYRKIKSDEKFCGDGNGDTGNKIINTNTGPHDDDFNNKIKDGESVKVDEGLVVSYNDELFYKPITKDNDLLYATDIYNLGSVFDCDWQGMPNIHNQLSPTTYQFPELEQTDILFELECIGGVKVTEENATNINRMCEIGVDLDDDLDIDENDLEGSIIRNNLITLNTEKYKYTSVKDITTDFSSTYYSDYRDYRNLNNLYQSMGNSFFFYFGPSPNKSSINLMNSKYFTQCTVPLPNIIEVVGIVTDVTTIEGEDGAITLIVKGGTPDYTYEWTDTTGTIISIDKDLTGLTAGIYTVTVTDDDGRTNEVRFGVTGIKPVQIRVTHRDSLPNVDGIIYINSITGGRGPYSLHITGGNVTTNLYEGLTSGINIEGLSNATYSLFASDSDGRVSPTSAITITELSSPSIINVESIRPSCVESFDGVISFDISGGLAPYTISLVGSSGSLSLSNFNDNLGSGDYILTVTDSYNQTTSPQVITIPPSLELVLTVVNPTNYSMLLNNTRNGDEYEVYNGETYIETITATGTSISYTDTSMLGGTYTMVGIACDSNPVTI